ncbi:zinc finger and SCAN domain-containing protein 12 [Drosophila pseudoobscura]|uniref:Zinc finger and SCAN domain-containing protein 12 n=1 Tax=Drosophila pseudoobscura pseudoobscura TaxID=46245 RepID=A0A6I8UMC7_DROPS|nr:zinc finger and SCAN domain-containing protein 12 [Drosophila pseudoobscura]
MPEAELCYPDLKTLCRLCLKEHLDAHTIFGDDATGLSIAMRLMACVSLDPKPSDPFPKKICDECRYQLEKSFLFRQRSQATEKKLRKHIRLLGLGKKSRVFSKESDDYDEDELEFEESVAFIANQEKVREAEAEKWREKFKENQEQEFVKRLGAARLELRQEVAAEVRKELADEVRQDVREELRNEVNEEIRREQLAKLVGELEVFLVEKKAGSWEPMDPDVKLAPEPVPDSPPAILPKHPIKRRLSSASKHPPAQCLKAEEVEFVLGGDPETSAADEVDLDPIDIEEDSPTDVTAHEFTDIKMVGVGAGDVVRTEDGEIYIINSTSTVEPKHDSPPPEFQQDSDITSYNIKDDGEIQFSGEKSEEMGDVVVFNLDGDISEEQQVYNFEQNLIIVPKEKTPKRESRQVGKRKRSSEFVSKQSPREPQPKACRVTDTVKTFQCQMCPTAFPTEKLLTRHHNAHIKNLKNGKGGSLQCPICELQLSCASSLKRHMIIHTGLKPYKCDSCDLSFSQREVLKRHMDIHTGAKRHKCSQCSSCFAQKSNLQQHIARVHMGNSRTHKCHLCDRSFNHVSGLSRHLVAHAGVMFSCTECGRQFNDRSAVQRHLQTVHKIQNKSVDYASEPEPELSEIEFQSV